jgi:hypothetical protein
LHGSSDATAAFGVRDACELGAGFGAGDDELGAGDDWSPDEQAVKAVKATKTTASLRMSRTLARTA